MIRSARRGRQGGKSSKLKHDHVTIPDSKKVKNLKSNSSSDQVSKTQKNQNRNGDGDDDDMLYDYEANTKIKGGRIKGNNLDDDRLINSKSKQRFKNENSIDEDDEDDEGFDEDEKNPKFLTSKFQSFDGSNQFNLVNSDDDESIDSDEAMGDFEPKKPGKKVLKKSQSFKKLPPSKNNSKKRKVRFESSEDSQEDEEDDEDLDSKDGDFIDASTMLEIGAESDNSFSDGEKDDDEDDQSSEDGLGQSSDEDEDDDEDEIDLNEEDESKLSQMAHLIQHLNASSAQKRKDDGSDQDSNEPSAVSAKRQKLLTAQLENRPESEVVAFGNSGDPSSRVKLEDLISNLPSNYDISSLKKTLKPLASKNRSSKSGPLAAPLDHRKQQKIERGAAYESTRKEIGKWDETTRANRGLIGKGSDGIHRFVAPDKRLNPNDNQPDAVRWNVNFKPSNSLESQVLSILQESQLSSKKIQEEESNLLQEKGLSQEQIKAKIAESRMTRELLFRAERKAKRVAKIKSKTFRKIRKKQRENQAREDEGGEMDMEMRQKLDEIDGGDRVKEETERLEIQRARERASLKHSSHGGAWAKKVSVLKGLDADANAAIQDRIRREELLKRKIEGKAGDEDCSDGSEEEESDSDDSDVDVEGIKARALRELEAIDSKENSQYQPTKGLMSMKFMQRAEAQKAKMAEEAEAAFRKELMGEEGCDSDDPEQGSSGMRVQGNPGRMVFGPDKGRKSGKEIEVEPDVQQSTSGTTSKKSKLTTRTSGSFVKVMESDTNDSSAISNAETRKKGSSAKEVEENPWLFLDPNGDGGGKPSKFIDLTSQHNNESSIVAAEKAKLKTEKKKRKNASGIKEAKEEAQVEIDLNSFLGDRNNEPSNDQVGLKALESMEEKNTAQVYDGIIRKGTIDGYGRTAIQQRELVSQAFADDGVVEQFEEEKRKEIEKNAPKKIDVTLPGWGDWGGKGARKSKHSKKFYKKVEGIKPEDRKDSKLSNVIISEKKTQQKKIKKFQTSSLPFPYTSSSQFEHKLRQSIGPEFNTNDQFRHLIRPNVLLYPGQIIEPVSEPKV